MADYSFNTGSGKTVDRELLVLYLNTGTSVSPAWSPIGKRVEDSSEDIDWQTNSIIDIFGDTYTTAKKPTITQTFDPLPLDAGDTAVVKIWNMAFKDRDVASLTAQDMLVVHYYVTHSTDYLFAERYSTCTVIPTGIGGAGGDVLSMPLEVTLGGTRTTGKAQRTSAGVVTFTADA